MTSAAPAHLAATDPHAAAIPGPPARGLWAAAWLSALHAPAAKLALAWIALVTLAGILAPVISSGHPLIFTPAPPLPLAADASVAVSGTAGSGGGGLGSTSPLWRSLTRVDLFLISAIPLIMATWATARALDRRAWRALPVLLLVVGLLTVLKSPPPLIESFGAYHAEERGGAAPDPTTSPRAVFTLNPWSPRERSVHTRLLPPGSSVNGRVMLLGSDALGQDVLSQLLHASRLAMSIGLVSTGVAVVIGVGVGALMGYFGGWVDAVLMRLLEIVMSVPTLFLLVTAAAVLPRDTYVLMALIGAVSWTGAARFTRAEFLRMRELDYVHAARAASVPQWSIVLRHMLPGAVTPVIVDAGFAIAATIIAEASLSYLGLGPPDQPSWGKLLNDAVDSGGAFVWWLAIFPGAAIFLTVLAYNVLSQRLRDAMNPKDMP